MIPKEGLTWHDWCSVTWGMEVAVREYGLDFEWYFTFAEVGRGELGFGSLSGGG